MRDEFSEKVKRILAQRVGGLCSNPDCRTSTSGPQIDSSRSLNIGVAAHMTAASKDGPRFDPPLSNDERSHPDNGIWMCQNCAKLIDSDLNKYTVELLRKWKKSTEAYALMQIGKRIENTHRASFSEEELNLLLNAADDGEVFVTKSFGVGTVIHVGGFEYGSRDPATAAQYLEAIEKMRRNRLVICTSKDVYQLTGTGFKIAREIKSLLDSGGV